jgi:hypothetical protein
MVMAVGDIAVFRIQNASNGMRVVISNGVSKAMSRLK